MYINMVYSGNGSGLGEPAVHLYVRRFDFDRDAERVGCGGAVDQVDPRQRRREALPGLPVDGAQVWPTPPAEYAHGVPGASEPIDQTRAEPPGATGHENDLRHDFQTVAACKM